MVWSTLNFNKLVKFLLPGLLRKAKIIAFLTAINAPLKKIADETLYKMQHDGRTIYLEKVLNEWFGVVGYDPQNHEQTKKIYIDDIPATEKLYIYQDEETESVYLEDEDSDDDVFLDGDNENNISYSWIIFIPASYPFNEVQLRANIDFYRYIGKKYTIQTYTI